MMAFENTSKRPTQDLGITPIDSKKRKVKFSDKVMMHTAESQGTQNYDDNVSTEMYKRFAKSALDELENVCLSFSLPIPLFLQLIH